MVAHVCNPNTREAKAEGSNNTSTNYQQLRGPLPLNKKKKKKKAQGCRDASVGKVIAAQTGELELRSPILGMWGRDT